MKRLFAAIKIEPENTFITLYNQLKSIWQEHKINWVPLNHIHLTLHFFGDTDERIIHAISTQLADAVFDISPFNIRISDFGIFGSSYKPRVIWMGIDENDTLNLLAQYISINLNKIGFTPDRQNFIPHITLGRIKYINDKQMFQNQLDEVKNKFIQLSKVEQLYLYESILSSKGPTYHIIETFYFKD